MTELIVALDLPSVADALDLVDRLRPVSWFKVGAPLYTRGGAEDIRALQQRDKHVFLDLKFHDIPNTVARAVEAAAELGVDLLTLHASGGSTMLRAARDANGPDGPKLLGVTLLTSFSAADVEEVWAKEPRSVRDEVARLAALAATAGMDGVVASALEAEALKRRYGPDFLVVTPGIRPAGDLPGDQMRTATPAEAIRAGADFIVVGRPIIAAPDPAAAAEAMLAEMAAAANEAG